MQSKQQDMVSADYENTEAGTTDIPWDLAEAAHSGTSMDPHRRAAQDRESYSHRLRADWQELSKLANSDEKQALMSDHFRRYRAGYRVRTLAFLAARSRIVSPMIVGPARFPVARMQKLNNVADKRRSELVEFRERALVAIRRALQPELRPIMAGDSDALERLRDKIAEAEQLQETMKAANAAIRKHKEAGEHTQVAALMGLGFSESRAAELLKPDYLGRVGFPQFELTNNGANIRRMKGRLDGIKRNQLAPTTVEKTESCRLEDCPPENRVRLFFDGKPAGEVRSRLKANGFRWTPSLECWQAYRNSRSLSVAAEIIKENNDEGKAQTHD